MSLPFFEKRLRYRTFKTKFLALKLKKHYCLMSVANKYFLLFSLLCAFLMAESGLKKLSLGEGWLNPVPIEEFNGRVVVVEMWGINCGPCRASIPHMISLQDKYREQGLIIAAPHRQEGS